MIDIDFTKKVLLDRLGKNFVMEMKELEEGFEFRLGLLIDFDRQLTVNCIVRKQDVFDAMKKEISQELLRNTIEALVYSLMQEIRKRLKIANEH